MSLKIFIYILLGMSIQMVLFAATIRVPQDQPTIQAAINLAVPGDTVLVSPGIYYERINFLGKDITLGSLFLTTGNKDYITETTITKDSLGTIITFSQGETQAAIITGFTIKNGNGTLDGDGLYGGGIFIKKASPTILNNIIIESSLRSCSNRGGGIAIKDSSNPLIYSNSISFNSITWFCDCNCYFGGGIWTDSTSNPIIGGNLSTANSFYWNYAYLGWDIYRNGSGPIINAQYNYFENCPPNNYAVYPNNQFDLSNCMTIPTDLKDNLGQPYSPGIFELHQNYPNPFNPSTKIQIEIGTPAYVILKIYDIFGRELETLLSDRIDAGKHYVEWNASRLSSGIYFYQLQSDKSIETKKLILLR
ncbi:MAG: T9SS type A sorting domain-containing protein [Bacteroidota bacterium]|nr:T9SS type A sorting domain-containing protein [Bacteroidota bacterium]